MSDYLDENVRSSSYVDIGDISFDSELSNNCALATQKNDFDVSYRPYCFLSGLLI